MIGEGQQVGGYTVLTRIGRGGLGEVFLAQHRRVARRAAIEVLSPELSRRAERLERYFNELRATSLIRHSGFVEILDCDVGRDGQAFIIRELLDGESLGSYLHRAGPLAGDLPFALGLSAAVARTLGAAHAMRIFHLDLRPDNVFLRLDEPTGRVVTIKILDFGIAKLAQGSDDPAGSMTGPPRGTPAYRSPEQCRGTEPADGRSDIYSLGCIFYEALCGSPPFVGDGVAELIRAHMAEAPQPLSARLPDLPPALDALVLRMLRKRPEERPQSMDEVAEALRECGRTIGVRTDQPLLPRTPVERRNLPGASSQISDGWAASAPGAITRAAGTVTQKPVRLDENVQFTVRRPKVVAPGRWHKLLAFAHLSEKRPDAPPEEPDPIREIERQALQMLDGDPADHPAITIDSDSAIPEEGEITFIPVVAGIAFNPRSVTFRWVKPVHGFSFDFRAPPQLDQRTARGAVQVFLGSVIVAEISVAIAVDGSRAADATHAQDHARPYRKIFASYSHRDLRVVEEFRTYAQALGDRYVLDCVDLRAGEVWTDAIAALIKDADVFQLFWSWNSMRSPYVRQEWEFALSLGDRHRIRPTYWEDPLPEEPGLPPAALKRLHFQRISSRSAAPGSPDQAASKPEPPAAAAETAPSAPSAVRSPAGAQSPAKRPRRMAFAVSVSALAVVLIVFFASRPEPMTAGRRAPLPTQVGSAPPLETIRIDMPGLPAGTVVTVDGRVAALPIVLPKGPHRHEIGLQSTGNQGAQKLEQKLEIDATRDRQIVADDFLIESEEEGAGPTPRKRARRAGARPTRPGSSGESVLTK